MTFDCVSDRGSSTSVPGGPADVAGYHHAGAGDTVTCTYNNVKKGHGSSSRRRSERRRQVPVHLTGGTGTRKADGADDCLTMESTPHRHATGTYMVTDTDVCDAGAGQLRQGPTARPLSSGSRRDRSPAPTRTRSRARSRSTSVKTGPATAPRSSTIHWLGWAVKLYAHRRERVTYPRRAPGRLTT